MHSQLNPNPNPLLSTHPSLLSFQHTHINHSRPNLIDHKSYHNQEGQFHSQLHPISQSLFPSFPSSSSSLSFSWEEKKWQEYHWTNSSRNTKIEKFASTLRTIIHPNSIRHAIWPRSKSFGAIFDARTLFPTNMPWTSGVPWTSMTNLSSWTTRGSFSMESISRGKIWKRCAHCTRIFFLLAILDSGARSTSNGSSDNPWEPRPWRWSV